MAGRLKIWNDALGQWIYASTVEMIIKEGLKILPVSKTASFTATFDDNFYNVSAETAVVDITLPVVTAGDIGKALFIKSLGSSSYVVNINDVDGASVSNYFALNGTDSVIMVAKGTNFATGRWTPILYSKDWTSSMSALEGQLANFVPYTGASSVVDLNGNTIDNVPSLTMKDGNITIQSSNTQTTLDTSGPDASLVAGNAYGNGNGGQAYLMAGSADYSTVGAVGDGGYIYMQVGAHGEAGGSRGYVRIDSPGMSGVKLHIDNITAERDIQFPNVDGTLVAGDGVGKITQGMTAPSSPQIGDLWVDTN